MDFEPAEISVFFARIQNTVEILFFDHIWIHQHQTANSQAGKLFHDHTSRSRAADDRNR